MEIKTFVLGELQTNCYLLIDQSINQCIIIDPADEANFLSEQILRQKLQPKAMIATHAHYDHLLAAFELQTAFNIPLYLSQKDLFLAKNLKKNATFWTKREIIEKTPKVIKYLEKDNQVIKDWQLEIISTPGHTPGSACLYLPDEKILFTGDTLFNQGIGRTDFSYGSKKELLASIKKLYLLPPETKILPGHGPESNLKTELKSLTASAFP